jgi:4'-phosphopantetheinyl transferase
VRQAELPRGDAWLTEAERGVLSGLRVPKRRADWLLGRWAAKRALVAAGLAPGEGETSILAAPSGAPEASCGGRAVCAALSLTHSHGVAAALVGPAGARVGIDLERIEERPAGFPADWFTEAEQAFVASAGAGEASLATTLVWSAKEAVMKALLEGLRIPAKAVEVSPERGPADGAWRPFEARGPGEEGWGGWWRAEDGFVLAAVSRPPSGPPERIG